MKNHRQIENTCRQNENLYKIVIISKRFPSWNTECDFYIRRTGYTNNISKFHTEKDTNWTEHLGIQILDETIRHIFYKMDMQKYLKKNVNNSYSIPNSQIHQCFNDERHKKTDE